MKIKIALALVAVVVVVWLLFKRRGNQVSTLSAQAHQNANASTGSQLFTRLGNFVTRNIDNVEGTPGGGLPYGATTTVTASTQRGRGAF